MTDLQEQIGRLAHQIRIEQLAASIRDGDKAANQAAIAEASATGAPIRLYAEPLILAAECAAVKARSIAKYGKKSHD